MTSGARCPSGSFGSVAYRQTPLFSGWASLRFERSSAGSRFAWLLCSNRHLSFVIRSRRRSARSNLPPGDLRAAMDWCQQFEFFRCLSGSSCRRGPCSYALAPSVAYPSQPLKLSSALLRSIRELHDSPVCFQECPSQAHSDPPSTYLSGYQHQ